MPKPYRGLPPLQYPFHDRTVIVTRSGCICLGRTCVNASPALSGQPLGISEVDEGVWLATCMIRATSTWRLNAWSPWATPSAPGFCNPCVRNRVSPM